jgi:hypothetical protein
VGVDEIIRTEFVEHSGVAREHGSIAPVLKSFDFVDCSFVFGHVVEAVVLAKWARPESKSHRHPGDYGNKCLRDRDEGLKASIT